MEDKATLEEPVKRTMLKEPVNEATLKKPRTILKEPVKKTVLKEPVKRAVLKETVKEALYSALYSALYAKTEKAIEKINWIKENQDANPDKMHPTLLKGAKTNIKIWGSKATNNGGSRRTNIIGLWLERPGPPPPASPRTGKSPRLLARLSRPSLRRPACNQHLHPATPPRRGDYWP